MHDFNCPLGVANFNNLSVKMPPLIVFGIPRLVQCHVKNITSSVLI